LLQESVSKVNEIQQTAGNLAAAFEAEDPNVDLAQVMIAVEKSGLAFQALTQVRNKLISAYQEIMNMPV
jgi:flagellar hook-basal body complex protein FliE